LLTSQISVVPAVTTWSTRPMSIDRPLIAVKPSSSKLRVLAAPAWSGACWCTSRAGSGAEARSVAAALTCSRSKVSSPPAKRSSMPPTPRSGLKLRSTGRSPGWKAATISARSPGDRGTRVSR
jgi:hypothetical protein